MDNTSFKLSVIAYYLSEYDDKAVKELGYKTKTEAFNEISSLMGKENNYLRLRRDEFDVLTSSRRKGWRNRPPIKDVEELYNILSVKTYDQITTEVKKILFEAKLDIHEDSLYIDQVNIRISNNSGEKVFCTEPQEVPHQKEGKTLSYERNPDTAINALTNADYKCEYDTGHFTFLRKSNGLPYTEPHHLIPMNAQKDFSISLDVENNIVSLCSHCHNLIHYGKDAKIILNKLYDERVEVLHKAGIIISFENLMKYYQ